MIVQLVLSALLGAGAPAPIHLASPGLTVVQMDQKVGDFYDEYFCQQLSLHGVTVTTRREVAQLLGLEHQKQLLSCSQDSSSCVAELIGALGVDGLITGSIGKLGSSFTVNVKIVSARDGHPLALASGRVKTEDALFEWLSQAAARLVVDLQRHGLGPEAQGSATASTPVAVAPITEIAQPTDSPSPSLRARAWIPAAAGGALLVGSGVLYWLATGVEARLNGGALGFSSGGDVQRAVAQGSLDQTLSVGCLIGGVVGVALGGIFWVAGAANPAPAIALTASPRGAMLTWGGALP